LEDLPSYYLHTIYRDYLVQVVLAKPEDKDKLAQSQAVEEIIDEMT
jgi:hypothetical protein